MDLSSLGQQFAAGGLLESIGRFVGGDRETTRKTLGAALPATMYTIADHGSTEIGAAGLLEGLRSGTAPQLDVADLGRTLGDPHASAQLLRASGGFLDRIFGHKIDALVAELSIVGGGDRTMTAKILALVAPLALGVIGRRVREGGLDAHGLAGFLAEQKAKVATLVPPPVRSVVGAPTVEHHLIPDVPVHPSTPVAPHLVAHGSAPEPPHTHWPLVLAGIAALFGLGWLIARSLHAPHPPTASAPTLQTRTPPEIVPAPAPAEARYPIADFLASNPTEPRRFSLDGITFASGDSSLSPSAQRGVEQLSNALVAHPDATIRIEGFADPTNNGAAGGNLGLARADAVKAALVGDGIDGNRIETAPGRNGIEQTRTLEAVVDPH